MKRDLHDLVVNNDLAQLKRVVKPGNVAGNALGETPLLTAVRLENYMAFDILYPYEKAQSRVTDLLAALFMGRIDDYKALLSQDCSLADHVDILGQGVHVYALHSQSDVALDLVLGKMPTTQVDRLGRTLLMHASMLGHDKCERYSMITATEVGSQKGILDNRGTSALMYAATRGFEPAIRYLLDCENGFKNKSGHNALYLARKKLQSVESKKEGVPCSAEQLARAVDLLVVAGER